jgi:hypothetical protein
MIVFLFAALLCVGTLTQANVSTQSSLLRVTQEVTTIHQHALIASVHEKARKLVDSTSENAGTFVDGDTFCSYMEESMSFEGMDDENANGDCSCSGTIEDILELTCSFQNVCEPEDVCGSVDFVIKLSNLVDGEGNLGDAPAMDVKACVDVDEEWMEEICLSLYFSGIDFVAPVKCEMTYDDQECMCNVTTVQTDETFDIEVPCMVWNCSDVVPDALKPYMAEDVCKVVSETDNATVTAVDPVMLSFAALAEVPPEAATELQAGSGVIATPFMVKGTSIFLVLSAAFLVL